MPPINSFSLFDLVTLAPEGGGDGGVPISGGESAPAVAPMSPTPATTDRGDDALVAAEPDAPGSEFDFPDDDGDLDVPAEPARPVAPEKSATTPTPTEPAKAPVKEPSEPSPTTPPAQKPATEEGTKTEGSATEGGKDSPAQSKSLTELLDQSRDQALKHMSETRFKLSQEESDAIESGDTTVYPKLLARTYFEAVRAMTTIMETEVPRMLIAGMQAQETARESREQFFGTYPDLKPHVALLQKNWQVLQQLNPGAGPDQIGPEAIKLTRAMAGLPAASSAPANGNGSGNGSAPAAKPRGRVSEVPSAFVPASRSAPGAPQPGPANEWEAIAERLLQPDEE